jgi:OFA family oxalate/formate antiporter-like MFS transporter
MYDACVLPVKFRPPREEPNVRPSRWLIGAAAGLMQGAVGATYAWSVFRDPLVAQFGWTIPEVTLAYSLNVFGLGISAFIGGLWMRRAGPRTVGLVAGLLYGLGLILTGLVGDRLWALYLGFGLIGGVGRGLGWVVPVAIAIKWFPDRRGLVSGLSLAGNGLGAVIAAPLTISLIEAVGVLPTFTTLGVGLIVVMTAAAWVLCEPPEDDGPSISGVATLPLAERRHHDFTVGEALRTPQWYGLWCLLFVSSTAGLAIFSNAAPMARELTGAGTMAAASTVGIMSLANAGGRLGWAWLSDVLGRRTVFVVMLALLATTLRLLPLTSGMLGFTLVAAIAMLCFGGGLGTLPAFASDLFGLKHVGPIMGLLMTAQGCAALVGPMLLAAVRETSGSYAPALSILALVPILFAALPLALRRPAFPFGVRAPIRSAARATRRAPA